MVIGTLAVDGWAVTFGTARRGRSPPSPLLAVPNVTAHPSTASVPTSYYLMWQEGVKGDVNQALVLHVCSCHSLFCIVTWL